MNKGVKEQPKKKGSVPQKKEKKKRKEKKREILKAIRNEHMIITPIGFWCKQRLNLKLLFTNI